MGRRKSDPLLQAAMGHPGRRQKKVEAEIQSQAEQVAEEVTKATGDSFPVPAIFLDAPKYWDQAIRVWKDKAESLRASGRRRPAYVAGLVRYCMWYQLFVTSAVQLRRDLPNGGTTVKVKKGDGEWVYRTHPSIDFMGKAETALRLLEAEYGFTPYSDTNLVRVETFNAAQGKLPFGGAAPGQRMPGGDDDPSALMDDTDSQPPTRYDA